uniref:ER membrane protein complex subunit 6 n=1 Tax=Amphimedon queenslandica TaxID=400682 RepID=A0A1X7V0W6_AMPQE
METHDGKKLLGETTIKNERAVRHNASLIEYGRTSISVIAGVTAGILGLTGIYGFGFYLIYSFVMSGLLVIKVGSKWNKYFQSRYAMLTDGVFGGLFTYVLLWTFVYGLVHVF